MFIFLAHRVDALRFSTLSLVPDWHCHSLYILKCFLDYILFKKNIKLIFFKVFLSNFNVPILKKIIKILF